MLIDVTFFSMKSYLDLWWPKLKMAANGLNVPVAHLLFLSHSRGTSFHPAHTHIYVYIYIRTGGLATLTACTCVCEFSPSKNTTEKKNRGICSTIKCVQPRTTTTEGLKGGRVAEGIGTGRIVCISLVLLFVYVCFSVCVCVCLWMSLAEIELTLPIKINRGRAKKQPAHTPRLLFDLHCAK